MAEHHSSRGGGLTPETPPCVRLWVGRVCIDGDSDRHYRGSNLTRVILLYPWE